MKYESTGWYRQQNDVWQRAIFQLLTGDEYKVKVYMDCQVSQHGHKTGQAEIDIFLASRFCNVAPEVVVSAITKLAGPRINYLQYQEIAVETCLTEDSAESTLCLLGGSTEYAPSAPGAHQVLRNETERNETERNETERNETKEDSALPAEAGPPASPDLLELWNVNCGALPAAREIGINRKRAWTARWRCKPDRDYWISVVKSMAANPFCTGENDRGWRADIDFFLKPDTHVRVLEGKYDSKAGSRRKTYAEQREAMHRELSERNRRGDFDEV